MTEHTIDGPFYAQTRLPTEHGDFDVRVYRDGGKEHLLISTGEVEDQYNLPVRIHSECLTGEVLGSLKCDCKPQLDAALKRIIALGRGAVLYLRQEGRGIGLGNKIRAYRLQEDGADTVDANRLLGFDDDLRDYNIAAHMLRGVGVSSVVLMTNNPLKISGLEATGIEVNGRIPISVGENQVNTGYLETKRLRMGHMLNKDRAVATVNRFGPTQLTLVGQQPTAR
ncbi:MAG: GTP cyclohydrolase II [Myxococcota bacterium]|nr:GTP cyclohydrolase II [Myxococcota bacterium]